MPAHDRHPARTTPVIDRAANRVSFRRFIAAPPDRVFSFWTEPVHLTQWWDASGEPLQSCTVDLTVGGTFTFTNRQHPDFAFTGRYLEIERPHRLVFEALGATGTVQLQASDHGTLLDVEIRGSNAAAFEHLLAAGIAQGTAQTIDNLAAHAVSAG